jgi:hypothetical protein
MHTSFLSHANARYLKVALVLVGLSIAAYWSQSRHVVPNGGTWLGYTLGTIGALLILWLIYLGRRKRNFTAGWGTVRGWVSAHVYLGTALLVVATLHTGFQFGMNVHTLAYALMCVVIFSGLFGVWAYRTYPEARNSLKRSQTLDDIFLQLEDIDTQLKRDVSTMASDIRSVITSAIDRTEIGGGIYAQIAGRDNSKVVIAGEVHRNAGQLNVVAWLRLWRQAAVTAGDSNGYPLSGDTGRLALCAYTAVDWSAGSAADARCFSLYILVIVLPIVNRERAVKCFDDA